MCLRWAAICGSDPHLMTVRTAASLPYALPYVCPAELPTLSAIAVNGVVVGTVHTAQNRKTP